METPSLKDRNPKALNLEGSFPSKPRIDFLAIMTRAAKYALQHID
jgi:hypothetical protein